MQTIGRFLANSGKFEGLREESEIQQFHITWYSPGNINSPLVSQLPTQFSRQPSEIVF